MNNRAWNRKASWSYSAEKSPSWLPEQKEWETFSLHVLAVFIHAHAHKKGNDDNFLKRLWPFKALPSSRGAIWIHLVFMRELTSNWLWVQWEQNERDSNQAEVMEWRSEIELGDRERWRDSYMSQPSSELLGCRRWEEGSSSGEISQNTRRACDCICRTRATYRSVEICYLESFI